METRKNIAISITTHNRYETFKKHYKEIKRFLPKNARLIIIDDGSDIPVKEADFRFEKAHGIAAAKNKAFELMGDADYYFCFDDDISPKIKDWHLPYMESGLNHACYTFGRKEIGRTDKYISYENPNGCMLFFTNKCLEIAGGFDVNFDRYFFEHVELSNRIYNMGLTPARYIDVVNSNGLFHSMDEHKEVKSSVQNNRGLLLKNNEAYFKSQINSKEFKPYK